MPKLCGGVPIESTGNVPVALQDQSTRMVVAPVHTDINTGNLLASPAVTGDTTITLTAGHGTVPGNCIVLREGHHWFFAHALAVVTNDVDLDTPIDTAFTTSAEVAIGDSNLNKDGSTVAVEAHIQPPPSVVWDLTRIHVIMTDNAAMDFTTFGGISALTNGVVVGKTGGPEPQNVANAKSNGDLIQLADSYSFEDKVGGGEYAFSAKYQFAGQDGAGVTMRLDNTLSEELRILIQDDLTAITQVRVVAIGHVVED